MRPFVRLEVRTLGVHLVASFSVALVHLAVLGEIIVAAVGHRIGGGGKSEGGTAASKVNPTEAAVILPRRPRPMPPKAGFRAAWGDPDPA